MAQETNEQQFVHCMARGDVDEIGTMLANVQIDINATVNGSSILYHALSSGNIEIAYLVLAQPNIKIDNAATFYAAALHNPDMLLLLINQGAKLYVSTPEAKESLLLPAVKSGCKRNVELLIEKKINVMFKDKKERDALDYAIVRVSNTPNENSIGILTVLLQNGAAFCRDLPSLENITPLMNHYEGCFFFDTKVDGELITPQTPGFESAVIIELNKEQAVEGIPHKKVKLRCEELLNQEMDSAIKKRLIQLQRCSRFISGEITLTQLSLEQLARQPNIDAAQIPYNLRDNYENLHFDFRNERRAYWCGICGVCTLACGCMSVCPGVLMWMGAEAVTSNLASVCMYTAAATSPGAFIVSGITTLVIYRAMRNESPPPGIQMNDDNHPPLSRHRKNFVSGNLPHRFFQRAFRRGIRFSTLLFESHENRELPLLQDESMENEISGENELLLSSSARYRNG